MEKQRKIKILSILALVLAIVSMSLGFAAFSTTLNISSAANVSPNSSDFSVLFSSSNANQSSSSVSGIGTDGATGGTATLSGTTISNLTANFTEPGQSVTYTFYAHNVGKYIAYLRNLSFDSGKSCVGSSDADDTLVQNACSDITVSVTIGDTTYSNDTNVYSHALEIDGYETVVVTISYVADGNVADGDFSVTFGDVSLTYSTVDGVAPTIITFGIMGVSYQGEEGMTWGEWINSDYNGAGVYVSSDGNYACTMAALQIEELTTEIISGKSYPSSIKVCS